MSVTLEFLITTYKRYGQFPSSQTGLYEQGCRILCEENNQDRRDAKLTGALTAEERMVIASRIAAASIFANKAAIWTDVDRGDVPEDDIVIQTLTGGHESFGDALFPVTEVAVRETLSTGLFSSRGPKRMGWAHQTYAEFLAASYLVKHNVALSQMMSLISAPGDLEHRVVPQLHETAAWLAGMVPDVFRTITRADPIVLLRSDIATADERERESLVDELLRLYDKEKLLAPEPQVRRYYGRLDHTNLAEQLRPHILDASRNELARGVAIDIAVACKLGSLQDDLVKVSLDRSQPHPVRANAAYAVNRIGDDAAKGKLKPLAIGRAGNDPDDQLKSCGLLATWPKYLTAKELFAVLTPPKQGNFIGFYHGFLSSGFVRHLQASDLPIALSWVEQQPSSLELPASFPEILKDILLKALENLDEPIVLVACARAILSRLRYFDEVIASGPPPSPLKNLLRDDIRKRHLLVEALVPLFLDAKREPPLLAYPRFGLVVGSDLLWMFDRFQQAESEHTRTVWKELIERVFYECEPEQLGDILAAIDQIPLLSEAFGEYIKPIDLNSPFAQRMREQARTRQEHERQLNSRPTPAVLPSERISQLLAKCESGDPSAWWQLDHAMQFDEDGRQRFRYSGPDLTTFPGWQSATDETRTRIVETAKQYVLHGEPKTSAWLGTNTLYHPALAGYRALFLLLQ